MQYTLTSQALNQVKVDCLVLGVIDDKKLPHHGQLLDKSTNRYLSHLLQYDNFSQGERRTLMFYQVPGCQAKRVLLIHFGSSEKLDDMNYVKYLQQGLNYLRTLHIESVAIAVEDLPVKERTADWQIGQIFQALANTTYQFTIHKTKTASSPLKKIIFLGQVTQGQLRYGRALVQAIQFAKDLGNQPGNICTPSYLAAEANKLARQYPTVKTRIYHEKQLEALGMGAFLSVARGSDTPAKLIILEYQGARQQRAAPYALIGKGVTFDSGGISLKAGAAMDEMKFDMMGGASVLATLQAVAELKLNLNLVVAIPATENMPNGKATKPGDIVKSMSGQTIEILNTDAEGRLILCDALTWIQRQYRPRCIIDVATLTGAITIALGKFLTGAFTNNQALLNQLTTAAQESHDKIWQLPLLDIYQNALKSNFADMANVGDRSAGSITAACFLARFIENETPWIHLDIAGTAWESGEAKGATGRPVPLLLRFLMNQTTSK